MMSLESVLNGLSHQSTVSYLADNCYIYMAETVIVRVAQGSLRGQKVKTNAGVTYYSFHAIPYAKPPVGPLRFKVSSVL